MAAPLKTGDLQFEGPHERIKSTNARERFALQLFDRLWDRYRKRVPSVTAYEKVVQKAIATFSNDHIALRTFACQQPLTGIASIARIFEALGYQSAACYDFEDKHLNAVHFQHANRYFPKVFVSELKTWELSDSAQDVIHRTLSSHRVPIACDVLSGIASIKRDADDHWAQFMDSVVAEFHGSPWNPPEEQDVKTLNEESQYAAWVLVHGYNVNHFTSLINSHGVESLDDIEKTVEALKRAGVPMKESIEGEPGSKLRQSATTAAVIDVEVCRSGKTTTIPWTYAYFELAERGEVIDPKTGSMVPFEGFLGPQATHLFEMTRLEKK